MGKIKDIGFTPQPYTKHFSEYCLPNFRRSLTMEISEVAWHYGYVCVDQKRDTSFRWKRTYFAYNTCDMAWSVSEIR